MKHILKKNQVIITALAIMIAVAGYLNFTEEKSNMAVANLENENTLTYADMEKVLMDLSEEDLAMTDESSDNVTVSDNGELVTTETINEAEINSDAGKAVMVSNTINSDFFSSARLTREQTRAKNKELLMEIVNNENISEAQKEEAINNIVNLTNIAEMESATEILLEAKGFTDVVVSIVDENVDVIINANDLTEQQIAQIQDIVKRKTEFMAENIVISPVGVQ